VTQRTPHAIFLDKMAVELIKADSLSPLLLREIEDFLDSQETSHPFQYPQWSENATCAMWRVDGSLRWFGTFGEQFPLGRRLPWIRALIANRGPVCDDAKLWQDATDELAREMGKKHFSYLEVSPDWVQTPSVAAANGFDGSAWKESGVERASLRLDIANGEDDIFAGFRKVTRYEIRRAERAGVSVVAANSDAEIDEFLELYARLAERKAFSPEPAALLQRQIRWLTQGSRGALLLARSGGSVLGGAVIGRSGRRCWYVWGATEMEAHASVGHLLQWNALRWAKAHGSIEYDFGGYTPGATSGPAWFKAGFGGTVVRFVAPRRRIIERGRYRVLNFFSKVRAGSRI
jgi:Acetyltransferase (GNAT) domain